jgi:hypothetical protein
MTQIKQDNRVPAFIISSIGVAAVCALASFAAFGVIGVLCVIGVMLIVFGLFLVWLLRFYRCPSCHRRLVVAQATTILNRHVRHHCSDCDITWESGVVAASTEEL